MSSDDGRLWRPQRTECSAPEPCRLLVRAMLEERADELRQMWMRDIRDENARLEGKIDGIVTAIHEMRGSIPDAVERALNRTVTGDEAKQAGPFLSSIYQVGEGVRSWLVRIAVAGVILLGGIAVAIVVASVWVLPVVSTIEDAAHHLRKDDVIVIPPSRTP